MEILITSLIGALVMWLTAVVTWSLARRKNNADAKSSEIDNEIKSAGWYQNVLDDMSRRLNESITEIEKRDVRIKDRDARIETLIEDIETLTGELRKYKQLNGKVE